MKGRLTNRLNNSFVWFPGLLVVLHLLAMLASPYRDGNTSSDSLRIDRGYRGWSDYLSQEPHSRSKQSVAIVSHSQATAREYDTGMIYPAILQSSYDRQGLDIAIENWSQDGLAPSDLEILLVNAAVQSIDLVVIQLNMVNIMSMDRFVFDQTVSDLDVLVGNPRYWPYLGKTYSLSGLTVDQLAWRFLQYYSPLAQTRAIFHDYAAWWIPWQFNVTLFGKWVPQIGSPPAFAPGDNNVAAHRQKTRNRSRKNVLEAYFSDADGSRQQTFRQLMHTINELLVKNGTRVVWVWGPMREISPEFSAEFIEPFNDRACEIASDSGVACYSLLNLLPPERFTLPIPTSHFDPEGHQRVAAALYPIILDGLK